MHPEDWQKEPEYSKAVNSWQKVEESDLGESTKEEFGNYWILEKNMEELKMTSKLCVSWDLEYERSLNQ